MTEHSAETAHMAIAAILLETDALTPNHDGTPEHYIVEAENIEYLVGVVLSLAAGREAQAAIERAADEMAAVVADGDVAEVAAYVPGEVGRAACVERRDYLLEDPVDWLRAYAAALISRPGPTGGA